MASPLIRIFSFHQGNIPDRVLAAQRAVFAYNGIPLEQYYSPLPHGEAIDECLEKNNWDAVALFDVDAFCSSAFVLKDFIRQALANFLVIGGAHNANHRPGSRDYASPACCVFGRKTWKRAKVGFRTSPGEDGQGWYDVGQKFSETISEKGGECHTCNPESVEEAIWDLHDGGKFGHGTCYGWAYHQFQGRHADQQESFIKVCRAQLPEKYQLFIP